MTLKTPSFRTMLALCGLFMVPICGYSQITADTTLTPLQLVQALAGNGITVSNVTTVGGINTRALYSCNGCGLPSDTGVMLSSGRCAFLGVPSQSITLNYMNGAPGDPDLANFLGTSDTNVFDASILEFDIQVTGDSIELKFFFASEEYNDYVNSNYFDGFAVFIDGQNIAVVPGTSLPITISTINNGQTWSGAATGPCENCAYYIDNWNGTNFTFDGYTTLLTATADVTTGQTYHIKIVIADLFDPSFDSALFLDAGSLQVTIPPSPCDTFFVDATPEDSVVCQSTIQLQSVATTSDAVYQWSPATGLSDPNIANPVVGYAFDQDYVVTATDTVTGCVTTDTINISVHSNYPGSAYICGTNPILLSLPSGADSYQWFSFIDTANVPFPLTDTTQIITASVAGSYSGSSYFQGCQVNGYIMVYDTCSAQPYVWPGDVNYDLVVNNVDFLYIGLSLISTGAGRSPISIDWQPWLCNNWGNAFANGVNYKNADCNGDGAVELIDTLAISQNYGFTHPMRLTPTTTSALLPDLRLVANKDTAGLNDWITVDIVAGSLIQAVDSLHGIAFTLNYNYILLDTTVTGLTYITCVLGNYGTDVLSMTKSIPLSNMTDVSLTRFDHQNVTDTLGVLGTFLIKTSGAISSIQTLHLSLSNVFGITAGGAPVNFIPVGDSVIIDPNFTGLSEITSSAYLSAPNPFLNSDFVSLISTTNQHVRLELYNAEGKQLAVLEDGLQNKGIRHYSITPYISSSGIYLLRMIAGDGVTTKRILFFR